jgi:hypothetical protein
MREVQRGLAPVVTTFPRPWIPVHAVAFRPVGDRARRAMEGFIPVEALIANRVEKFRNVQPTSR